MKRLLLLFFCSPFTLVAQQSAKQNDFVCSDEMILAVKGTWDKTENVTHTPASAAKSTRIDAISKLFQAAYSNPRGTEPTWYRSFNYSLFTDGGPQAYSFSSLYKHYYCNQNYKKLMLGEETGTWAYAFINQFSWFMSNQYDKLDFTIGGRNVYRLPKTEGEWKGYPLYNATAHDKGTFHCILILRPGTELPWRPITQQHYLTERKKIWQAHLQQMRDVPRKTDSMYNRSIKDVKENTFMKPEDKAKMIDNFEKARDKNMATFLKDSGRQAQYWQKKIDVIDAYIAQSDAKTLQQAAVIKNTADFAGKFETEAEGGHELVTANPNYFKKQFKPDVPQMILLYWKWERGPAAKDFKQQFEANFPVEKLQAMIDK